jgi:putative oxidoreductase
MRSGKDETMTRSMFRDSAALLGRWLLAALFLHESWMKLTHFGPSMAYMERFGVPGWLLPGAVAVELGGGILLVLGLFSRHAALALAVFCIAAAGLFHNVLSDGNQLLHFEKDLAIAGGLLVLCAFGPGRFVLPLGRPKLLG